MTKKTVLTLLVLLLASALIAADSPQLRRVEPRDLSAAEIGAKLRNGRNILLRTAIFDPATERPDYQSVGLPRAARGSEYAIVQFRSGDSAAKAELERLGVKFFGYLPDHAYQVRIPSAARQQVAANASVRWVGDYEAGFKVHPRLWPSSKQKMRAIRVVPFADASIAKTVLILQRRFKDLEVTHQFDDKAYAHFFEVVVPAGTEDDFVRAAAALDGVAWIEPNDAIKFHNSSSSSAIQGNTGTAEGRTIFAHNITGTGQIIAVADSGLDADMCYFRTLNGVDAMTEATTAAIPDQPGPLSPNNKVIAYWVQPGAEAYDTVGAGYHGTHTAGTVAGDNFAHPSSATDPGLDSGDGMAPNAQILFQDVGKNDTQGSFTVADPYAMMLQALRGGARVHSNSYGSASEGAYTIYEQILDSFLFEHDEMAIFFSAGNENEPGVPSTIGSPANAKNVISIGAVGAGLNTSVAIFSSRGPTADGRVKPDLVAPGVGIVSAMGDSTTTGGCQIVSKQGTSMSAPTAAGGAALLRQYFADGYYPTGTKTASNALSASGTLVKAVLLNGTLHAMNSATFGSADFGTKYGWGKIFLDNNLYFPGDARRLRLWDLPNSHGLVTGETRTFNVSVAAGQELRVTLVWSDPEAALGAAKALVNDLDLVVAKGSETYLGNVFGAAGDSTSGGAADRLNNVEQVRLSAPTGGVYTITVNAPSVPGNGRASTNRQGFALVVSGATCSTSIAAAPANLTAKTNATRGIDLNWTAPSGATLTQIYRATGSNPAAGDFRYIASTTGTSFTDVRAQGGFTYTYKVRGADDCGEGPVSGTVTFTSTGLCDLTPQFSGIVTAQADATNCRINLSWGTATSSCPLGNSVRYNIYRSTNPDFVPSGTPYATINGTTYSDLNVASGTTYYYLIRAEDTTNGSGGPHGGNEDSNMRRLFATAFGPPGATVGTFSDGAGDGSAYFNGDVPWQIGVEHGHTGTHSYRNGPDFSPYSNLTCAALVTPPLALDANAELSYWARYNLEYQWDGVIVEISNDNGATWQDLPPAGGYPDTLAETQPSGQAPINQCGYPATKGAFTGPAGNPPVTVDNHSLTPWTEYKSSLAAFAGQTVKIRWRFTSDPATEFEGFFLDDVAVSNVKLPGSCNPIEQKPVAAFTGPSVATRGVAVSFRDSSTNAPTSWLWNFGDGATSTDRNPTHTFATAGTYTVSLTATNAHGSSTIAKTIKINEPSTGGPKKRRSARH
jgi:hypothetical protein